MVFYATIVLLVGGKAKNKIVNMPSFERTACHSHNLSLWRRKRFNALPGLVIWLTLWCCVNLTALAALNVSRLSPDNGLSQGVVYAMKLDSKGQLWLATESDLDRFDGSSVEHTRPLLNLSSDIVWDFDFISDTTLHIATADAGLIEVDLLTGNARYLQRGADDTFSRDVAIYLIRQDAQQTLWYANALSVYQLNEAGQLTEVFSFSDKDPIAHHIRDLLRIDNKLIIATSMGLYQLDLQSKVVQPIHYLPKDAIADQLNSKALLLHGEHLLIGTVHGLYRLPVAAILQSGESLPAETLLPEHNIWKIKHSSQYGLLLGTNAGLLHLDNDTMKAHTLFQPGQTSYGYADDTILDFIELGDGTFWLGSRGDGAYFWHNQFSGFDNVFNRSGENRLSHNFVFGLYSTPTDLWIGTQNGLNRYHWQSGETEQFLVNSDNTAVESGSTIYGIYPDQSGRYLWLLTAVSLSRFDTVLKQVTPYTTAQDADFFQQYFYNVTQTATKELLAFTINGAFWLKNDTSVVPLKQLSSFLSTPEQAQWFGANPLNENEYLFFYQGAIWQYSLQQDTVSLVYQVPEPHKNKGLFGEGMQQLNQSLWFLISGLGLVELDSVTLAERSRFFNQEQPALTTSTLYALQQDTLGYLWMSSHSGLWRFNPEKRLLRQFTHRSGLAYNEFNGTSSHFAGHNGKMVFGSMRGVTIFEPGQFISSRQIQPTLYFTKTSLESKALATQLIPTQQQQLQLTHDDYGLRVQVSAFNYKAQSEMQYRFNLSGPMDLPKYIKSVPQLALPSLKPGNYSLTVTAFDPAAEQYSLPAQLQISVAYPPWRSPLAYMCYLAILLCVAAFWFHSRFKQRMQLLQQHNALKQVNNKLELALAVASSDAWEADLANDSLMYSNRMALLFAAAQPTCGLDDYLAKLHPDDKASYYQNWQALKDNESTEFNCIYRIKAIDGQWRWFKDVGKLAVFDADTPQKLYGLYTDITLHKLTEQELEHLSHYDQITGLPNRNLLQQYLIPIEGASQFTAFIVIKLLQFNEIKSAFGDLATNAALLQISSRLRSKVSTPDLLIHAAESTFIVALANGDADLVAKLSEHLRSLIISPVVMHEQDITLSCIAGTSCQTIELESASQLLKQAEIALRMARESGSYQHFSYQTGLLEQAKQKFILQQQLREAIAQDKLLNYYQPIINAQSGQIVGVELLTRWQHDGQFVPPDVFIPIAEQSGLIDELAYNSLATACDDINAMANTGHSLYLSINLTATQLCSKTMLMRFRDIVTQRGISPSVIRLEITESTIIQNKDSALYNMNELRSAGFQIFLDDFGTGYSSLKYIQDFPLDAIKIDRSFVSNISNNTAIIDTVIALADSLGVICIAEGVETSSERDYLISKGCHYMQGYLYSKPIAITQLLTVLSTESMQNQIFIK
ncbi:MAG: hypothetical protein CVV11_08215 [Gammaproteobacteria bacterium HGW-Gammaproteobacteria-15]|nr:MAG: hypothetical protein CVV11_08215 [Gammaproteobacteria bacterium HGW-Gammaproteobacteria-15]